MEEILPNLWLSNLQIANDLVSITSKNIDVIVNCSKNYNVCSVKFNYRLPISSTATDISSEFEVMYNHLSNCVDFIYEKINQEQSVLVCCPNAKQVSPTVIVAFIMKYGKVSIPNAIRFVESKYKGVFKPNMIFRNSLEMYQKYLIQ